MVAAFLKAELTSERFADELKQTMQELSIPESIVAMPNLQDKHENELRTKVLGDYRVTDKTVKSLPIFQVTLRGMKLN